MKKLITLTIFSFLMISTALQAQTKKGDKVPGYIIDNSGKKTTGYIIYSDWANNQVQVKFIKKGSSKKEVYKPSQLKAYSYEEELTDCLGKKEKRWVHYETRKADRPSRIFGPTTVFMHKEVSEGHYSLFCFYVEIRNNVKKPYEYSFFVEDDKGNFTKVTDENFESIAGKLFKDYTAMKSKLGDKDFRMKNMDRLVADYNYWKEHQHNPNEYKVAMKE